LLAADADDASSHSPSIAIIDALESLVAQNLIHRFDKTVGGDEARFGMLETIREYALERLEASGERPAAEACRATYCRALAERGMRELLGADIQVWMVRLDRELENFRAVVQRATTGGDAAAVEQALKLVGSLWWFCRQRAYLAEGREWADALLQLHPQRDRARGWSLLTSFFGWVLQDSDTARARGNEALSIGHELADDELAGLALVLLALVTRPPQRKDLLLESLAIFRRLGHDFGAGRALLHLASDYSDDPERARSLLAEALVLFQRIGHQVGVGSVRRGLGEIAFREGRWDEAQRCFDETIAIWSAAEYRTYIPAVLVSLGDLAMRRADVDTAAATYREALALATEIGGREHALRASARLADLATARDRAELAQPPRRPGAAARKGMGGLTERQLEVARLIGQGRTNREVAAQLVVSERTAEHHVENILTKLELTSRTQLGIWAVEHGLTAITPLSL
jgi:DNA-binding CsgD family transcriptional regulator